MTRPSGMTPAPETAASHDLALAAAGALPSWNLADLYDSPDSPHIAADFEQADQDAVRFANAHAGKLEGMTGAQLAAAIAEFERIEESLGRLISYAQLLFSADSTDPAVGRFYQMTSERVTAVTSRLLFFTLDINRLDDAVLEAKLADPAASAWRPWLRDVRVFRPHDLSEQLEKLLHEKDVSGAKAWNRLFDETIAGVRLTFGDEELTLSAVLNRLSDRDRSVREAAGRAVGEVLSKNIRLLSLITNTLAKDKATEDTWRGYPRPGSYRNRSNMVEDEVVDALVQAVVTDFPRLSHRYYSLKAKWLGLPKLQHWDRNAPLPDDSDAAITWEQARGRVLDSYKGFSPTLGEIGQRFFDNGWIDAALRPGKAGGAFAHPVTPSTHPYILMNYHGRTRDVMTLAHELGHGVHQVLAAQRGYLMSSTPLTLAETASVFGEMMTFRSLLDAETDPARRRVMLASKVEDMLNTVVRQIAFYRFEQLLHDERKDGELLPARIGEIWMQVQTESLGPAFEFTPDYANFWAYVPHFVHSPFYVYAYAFGDCLVNALYAVFQSGHPGFEAKYLEMLKAGGTKRHKELLAPFGLDASDPAFWKKGLDVISGFIDELEAA